METKVINRKPQLIFVTKTAYLHNLNLCLHPCNIAEGWPVSNTEVNGDSFFVVKYVATTEDGVHSRLFRALGSLEMFWFGNVELNFFALAGELFGGNGIDYLRVSCIAIVTFV